MEASYNNYAISNYEHSEYNVERKPSFRKLQELEERREKVKELFARVISPNSSITDMLELKIAAQKFSAVAMKTRQSILGDEKNILADHVEDNRDKILNDIAKQSYDQLIEETYDTIAEESVKAVSEAELNATDKLMAIRNGIALASPADALEMQNCMKRLETITKISSKLLSLIHDQRKEWI